MQGTGMTTLKMQDKTLKSLAYPSKRLDFTCWENENHRKIVEIRNDII